MHNGECNRTWMQMLYQINMVWFHPALINLFQHEDVDEKTVNVVENFAWHNTGF